MRASSYRRAGLVYTPEAERDSATHQEGTRMRVATGVQFDRWLREVAIASSLSFFEEETVRAFRSKKDTMAKTIAPSSSLCHSCGIVGFRAPS